MKFKVVYSDPPWSYRDKAGAGKRGSSFKYPVMKLPEIKALPVADIAEDDSLLFLWATMPMLPDALEVIGAWGFKYRTVAFTWVKAVTPPFGRICLSWGMGNWTRANAEVCLLGIRGKPKRVSASVHSVVIRPRLAHSEKPPEVRERIVNLCGDVPRIELFARQRTEGWSIWGNEVDSDIQLGEWERSHGRKNSTGEFESDIRI